MDGILSIKPEDAKSLHPAALGWFNDERASIERELPLGELPVSELNVLLHDTEKRELNKHLAEISKALGRCTLLEEGVPLGPLDLQILDLTSTTSRVDLLRAMHAVKALLAKAYTRKKEEQKKREDHRRRQADQALLRSLLWPIKENHEQHFKTHAKDSRYTGHSFAQVLSRADRRDCERLIIAAGRQMIDRIVPTSLYPSIQWNCFSTLFGLPSAEYSLGGVSCLNLSFDVFAVVELRLWLEPMKARLSTGISGLSHEAAADRPAAEEPEFVGYHYHMLTPDVLGQRPWQSVPLVLLKGLLDGEVMPQGTTISATSTNAITYKVKHFDGEITIPDRLAGYLKAIGSIDKMVDLGILTDRVGAIAKAELARIGQDQGAFLAEGAPMAKDTRKARAFGLFSRGKRPSDPSVKALGLKPATAYRYFQSWKKAVN